MEFVEPVAAPTPPIAISFHVDTSGCALPWPSITPEPCSQFRVLFPVQNYLSVSCPLTSASCLSMPLVIPLPPETCGFFFWTSLLSLVESPTSQLAPFPYTASSYLGWDQSCEPSLPPSLGCHGLLRKLTHSTRDQCHSRLQTSNPAPLKAWPALPTGHSVTTQFPQTPSATCQSSSF